MNILTDILGLAKRKKFLETAKPTDVLVIGISEEPDMTGVASPVPYKDVKLIKVEDLIKLSEACEDKNIPLTSNLAGISLGEIIDPNDPTKCYNGFRRLKSLSNLFTIQENGDFVEFDISNLIIYINSLLPPTPPIIPWNVSAHALDVGKSNPIGFRYPRQVIFTSLQDPATGANTSNYGSVYIVPYNIQITEIQIKWRLEDPFEVQGVDPGEVLTTWKLGKITDTSSTGSTYTQEGNVNFTDSNEPLLDLRITETDSSSFPYKKQILSAPYELQKDDMLVLIHEEPLIQFNLDGDSDFEVMFIGNVKN